MYYEASIKHDYITEAGDTKVKTDKIFVNNANLFAEAEEKALVYGNQEWTADNFIDAPDVTALKRSRLREFANNPEDGEKIYLATLDDVFIADNGKEKHMKYVVGIYADNITKAKATADNYLKQGLNGMTLTDLNETKFLCVVE